MNSAPSWSPGLSSTSSLAIFTVRPDLKSTSNVTLKPCLVVVMAGHPGLLDVLGLPWDEVYSMYAMMDLLKVIVPVIFITPRPLSFARVAHVVTSASIDVWQVTSLTCSHVLITHLTIISKKKIQLFSKTLQFVKCGLLGQFWQANNSYLIPVKPVANQIEFLSLL